MHPPEEEVLRLAVLGGLQEAQGDGDPVHRGGAEVPLQHAYGRTQRRTHLTYGRTYSTDGTTHPPKSSATGLQ